jgi:hypothetical protein
MKPRPELVREALESPEVREIRQEWLSWTFAIQDALGGRDDQPVLPWDRVDVEATVAGLAPRARAVAELIFSQPTAEAGREEFLRHDRSWSKGLTELVHAYCEAAAGEGGR